MHLLHLLASGGAETKTLWDPTILGVLTVLSGIVLFCGSAYMLLATNVGARQGFLIAFSALTGWIMLLGLLWFTTNTPLNVPKGRVAEWQAVSDDPAEAILSDLSASSIDAVRRLADDGTPVPVVAPEGQDDLLLRSELRPAVEAALVTPGPTGPEPPVKGPLNLFADASVVLTEPDPLLTYEIGGGAKAIFWHEPRYAAIQFCPKLESLFNDPNEAVTAPECDPAEPTRWLVLERDLGSLRLPAFFYFSVSGLLFALSLYALHIKERADQAAAAGALTPASA